MALDDTESDLGINTHTTTEASCNIEVVVVAKHYRESTTTSTQPQLHQPEQRVQVLRHNGSLNTSTQGTLSAFTKFNVVCQFWGNNVKFRRGAPESNF